MNPSVTGWITMFFNLYNKEKLYDNYKDDITLYSQLRNTGFLYGMSTKTAIGLPKSNLKLTENEFTKINLLHAMCYIFYQQNPKGSTTDVVQSLLNFYKEIEEEKNAFLQFFKLPKSPIEKLEDAIHERTNTNILSNSLTSLLSNIQIFLDVLAYRQYLINGSEFHTYLKNIKQLFFQVCFTALHSKKEKDKYDYRFLHLIESSSTYLNDDLSINQEDWHPEFKTLPILEKLYFVDLSVISVWSDYKLEDNELKFLYSFADKMDMEHIQIEIALAAIKGFAIAHEAEIKLFEYAHPIKRLYGQSSNTVKTLIIRNKDRLLIELNESGELLNLLGQATYRELTPEEKIKVRRQLLDICKSIPSLTIFLLPGGSLLLPLLIKFIPQLLPSAFVDNKIKIKSDD